MAITDNISHYWKLDESSGNATDTVGSATLTNNNTATYSAGKINNGLNLAAASSQYMSVGSAYTITAAFSVAFWLKITATGSNYYVFSSPTISSSACIEISVVGSDNKIHYSNFLAEVIGSTVLSAGTWYHIAVTSDGTNSVVYVNGTSVGSGSGVSHSSSSQNYQIGRRADTSNTYLDGSVDEFGIWDRQLTAGEITSLYNSGSGLAYPFTSTSRASLTLLGVS